MPRNGLLVIARPVEFRHAHAAQAKGRDPRAVSSKCSQFHRLAFQVSLSTQTLDQPGGNVQRRPVPQPHRHHEPDGRARPLLQFNGVPHAALVVSKTREGIRLDRGLPTTIGIGSNRRLARIASDFQNPYGLTVVPAIAPEEVRRLGLSSPS
jgi:nucleotidyltransferase/DNA polymerase involved in DNA repair